MQILLFKCTEIYDPRDEPSQFEGGLSHKYTEKWKCSIQQICINTLTKSSNPLPHPALWCQLHWVSVHTHRYKALHIHSCSVQLIFLRVKTTLLQAAPNECGSVLSSSFIFLQGYGYNKDKFLVASVAAASDLHQSKKRVKWTLSEVTFAHTFSLSVRTARSSCCGRSPLCVGVITAKLDHVEVWRGRRGPIQGFTVGDFHATPSAGFHYRHTLLCVLISFHLTPPQTPPKHTKQHVHALHTRHLNSVHKRRSAFTLLLFVWFTSSWCCPPIRNIPRQPAPN